MIPAKKNAFLDSLLYFFLRRLTRRSFQQVSIRGMEHLQRLPANKPALVFSNHTNWWDALMVLMLTRVAHHKKFYCMMEEKNLKSYRFFSWLGAFGVDLDSPSKAAASLRYAVRLLKAPTALMWIFPQGKMVPHRHDFTVQPGAAFLAQHSPEAVLLPVAFRYEFFREQKPVALIEIGAPLSIREVSDAEIQKSCLHVAAKLDEAVRDQSLENFTPLFTPSLSINKRWQWLSLAARGKLAEFNPAN